MKFVENKALSRLNNEKHETLKHLESASSSVLK